MQLEKNVRKDSIIMKEEAQKYIIFAEQYLEKPVYGGKDESKNFSVTVCTWRGIPTVDDF